MLDKIARVKKEEVKLLKAKLDIDKIPIGKEIIDPYRCFNKESSKLSVIAEVKKASPVKGILNEDLDHCKLGSIYKDSGAAAISVITDQQFFHGDPKYLSDLHQEVDLPLLRKDFIIDEIQLYQTLLLGADLVLIIVAMHDYATLLRLSEKSLELGIQPLIEVHERGELNQALDLPAKIIGINNRNLKDFQVNIDNSLRLSEHIPDSYIKVSESGIKTSNDMRALEKHGFNAALIGETLVVSNNPGAKLRELVNYREG